MQDTLAMTRQTKVEKQYKLHQNNSQMDKKKLIICGVIFPTKTKAPCLPQDP